MKQKQRKKAGFSLIEVLFAVLFLTIIVFGVLKLQTSNLVLANTQQNELKAYFYVSQALEIAQALGPEAFKPCSTGCHLVKNGENYILQMKGQEILEEGLFSRTLEVTDAKLLGGILLTSKVLWSDSSGEHQVMAKRVIF